MTYPLPAAPSPTLRSSLLSIVIGLHVGGLMLLLVSKTVIPAIIEMPLTVDLLTEAETVKPRQAPTRPVSKPQPLKQTPPQVQPPPTPLIEASRSTEVSPSAALAARPESQPAMATTPTPASEPPVSLARFDVATLRNPAPPYPPLSRRMGEEGKVMLRVLVNPQGTPDNIEVKRSSGSQRLDDAAVNTVKRWKFISAKQGDTPVPSWVLIPIIFKLEQ